MTRWFILALLGLASLTLVGCGGPNTTAGRGDYMLRVTLTNNSPNEISMWMMPDGGSSTRCTLKPAQSITLTRRYPMWPPMFTIYAHEGGFTYHDDRYLESYMDESAKTEWLMVSYSEGQFEFEQ